jgi:secreted PhoX family phosphatase
MVRLVHHFIRMDPPNQRHHLLANSMNNRRDFIKFLGRTSITAYGFSVADLNLLSNVFHPEGLYFTPIAATDLDDLVLAKGFHYDILIKWGESINAKENFGTHNDFIAFVEGTTPEEGILWVNHEYLNPLFIHGQLDNNRKTLSQVHDEMDNVGGSILRVRKDKKGRWKVDKKDPINRRLTARTEIPFAWSEPVKGATKAIGTLANCAGGKTPWGSILTCEENYDMFWGERDFSKPELPKLKESSFGWERFYDYPPEHYGWVVEINPLTGAAKKLVAMGRFCHEAAAVDELPDKRCVVYMGDDTGDEHFYKFIADTPGSLDTGKLYVANLAKGEWRLLDVNENPKLKEKFGTQTEMLVRCREAAKVVQATPLNRPEDVEIHPITGDVYVCLTNNAARRDLFGSILRLTELEGREGLKFKSSTFLAGGKDTGFACPDNMVFDRKGNLWFTSDMSDALMNKDFYLSFHNNGLFFVPIDGPNAGKAFQVASAPMGAEFTGPCFSPNYDTLFLCVQHPGDSSPSTDQLTSHFPDGGIPRSVVVGITGEALMKIGG